MRDVRRRSRGDQVALEVAEADVDRSLNTVRAYAYDLKDYWTFLAHQGLDWREVRLEGGTWPDNRAQAPEPLREVLPSVLSRSEPLNRRPCSCVGW